MVYKARLVDQDLKKYLQAMGAVLIEGPKGCGKTTTGEQVAKSAQIYDKWVTNTPKRVGSSFPPSLAATFNLTGFNGSDFGSWPRSPEGSPGGATEGTTEPTAGAAVTGIVARYRHQLYNVGLASSRSELPLSLMM